MIRLEVQHLACLCQGSVVLVALELEIGEGDFGEGDPDDVVTADPQLTEIFAKGRRSSDGIQAVGGLIWGGGGAHRRW